jgi:hypothetical protein
MQFESFYLRQQIMDDEESKISRVLVPSDFFKYIGAASTGGHSLY